MSVTPTLQGVPLTGLRLGAPLGSGAHGVVWAATTDAGERVAVRVLPDLDPAAHAARARRLEVLRGLRHANLVALHPVPEEVDERLLVAELVTGPTLATVRAGRMGLTAAEALGLAHALAGALATLHEHGLAHGDVSPANVLITDPADDGARPVLVDLAADLGWEVGTAGFSAPEVRAGAAPGPAADVWSLATLCVWAARPGDRDQVARVLGGATVDDPAVRPAASDLVGTLAAHDLEAVRVPPPSVLAGATLREQAQRAATTVRPARRRRPRHRRTPRTARLVVGALVASAAVAAAVTLTPDGPGPAPGAVAPRATDALDVRVAALVAQRDEALVAGDAAALAALTAPGSPAREQDAALLASLADAGTTLQGLRTEVAETEVVALDRSTATVRTVLTQQTHERLAGAVVQTVPNQPPRCVELALTRVEGSWVVAQTRDCD